jgi:hypothetical protein
MALPGLLPTTSRAAVVMQSSRDEVKAGEYIDYAYMHSHTWAVVFEVSSSTTTGVSMLPNIVNHSNLAAVAYVQGISALAKE